jgi:hypothetical protein
MYLFCFVLFVLFVVLFVLCSGGDEFASKVAGQELIGLKAFFHARVKRLHFPFMCLIDYKGYRLIGTFHNQTKQFHFHSQFRLHF